MGGLLNMVIAIARIQFTRKTRSCLEGRPYKMVKLIGLTMGKGLNSKVNTKAEAQARNAFCASNPVRLIDF